MAKISVSQSVSVSLFDSEEEEEIMRPLCDLCCYDKLQIRANFYCEDCLEYLCEKCHREHQSAYTSEPHSVVPHRKMPLVQGALATCPWHSEREVSHICFEHRQICCFQCASSVHSNCGTVARMNEENRFHSPKEVCDKTIAKLKTISNSFDTISRETERNIRLIKYQRDAIYRKITAFRKELATLLNRFELSLAKEIRATVINLSKEMTSRMEACKRFTSEIKDSMKFLHKARNKTSSSQMTVLNHKAFEECGQFDDELKKTLENATIKKLDFDVDRQLVSIVQNLKEVGEFKVIDLDFDLKQISAMQKAMDKAQLDADEVFTSAPIKIKTATKVGEFSAKMTSDTHDCSITGLTFNSPSKILITDFQNKTLKLFDSTLNHVSRVNIGRKILDVCLAGEKDLAVSAKRMLQLVSVERVLRPHRKLHNACHTYGILYHKEKLVTVCRYHQAVHVFSLKGAMKQTIDKNERGEKIFSEPYYIAASPKGDFFYVTDEQKGLVCISENGSVVWTYSDQELRAPRGVTVDEEGYIYVCGQRSNNVHHVSPDGMKQTILLDSKELTDPWALSYNASRSILLIGFTGNEYVHMYKLEWQ